jgi:hypothetical protein
VTQRNELERGLHRLGADVVLGTRSGARLFDVLAREDAERNSDGKRRRKLREGSGDGMRQNLEVRGLAPDQAAERHDRVETSSARKHRGGRWQLERAGDLKLLDLRVSGQRRLDRPLGKGASDLVVPARAQDGHPRAAVRILSPGRSLPRGRHLPQSSPRMQDRMVSA